MGGCCCCASRRAQLDGTPVYYYCPQAIEERQPSSSPFSAISALSPGFLVDTNLDTSTPDTYRSPPAPIPYDTDLGRPQTPPNTLARIDDKNDEATKTEESGSVEKTIISGTVIEAGSLNVLDCTKEADSIPSSPKKTNEPSKLSEYVASQVEEDDVCPTCLDEYDDENPRIITKCKHHFHLSCILEWMERSDTCPVCDEEMIFDHTVKV